MYILNSIYSLATKQSVDWNWPRLPQHSDTYVLVSETGTCVEAEESFAGNGEACPPTTPFPPSDEGDRVQSEKPCGSKRRWVWEHRRSEFATECPPRLPHRSPPLYRTGKDRRRPSTAEFPAASTINGEREQREVLVGKWHGIYLSL